MSLEESEGGRRREKSGIEKRRKRKGMKKEDE